MANFTAPLTLRFGDPEGESGHDEIGGLARTNVIERASDDHIEVEPGDELPSENLSGCLGRSIGGGRIGDTVVSDRHFRGWHLPVHIGAGNEDDSLGARGAGAHENTHRALGVDPPYFSTGLPRSAHIRPARQMINHLGFDVTQQLLPAIKIQQIGTLAQMGAMAIIRARAAPIDPNDLITLADEMVKKMGPNKA